MEGYGRKNDVCPQLLNLISKEWISKSSDEGGSTKLELNLGLGPPGGEWSNNTMNMSQSPWHINPKESSQNCSIIQKHSSEKKAFSSVAANTAVSHSTAQKRSAPAPVIGWPPIRSFRKNLASKSSSDSQNVGPTIEKKAIENSSQKGMFVKINMDCIPIGRKVNLNAYDSYEKLSSSVDQLFKGLLAAQRDRKDEGEESITGLLDGSGEYTLVYEDNEGDRMLVGDVPWSMFVSTVKRLRVLKSSELSMLRRKSKHGKLSYKS